MGEDTVKKAIEILNKRSSATYNPDSNIPSSIDHIMRSSSSEIKLSGAVNFENEGGTNRQYDEETKYYNHLFQYLVDNYKLDQNLAKSLVFTYGSNSLDVLNIGNELNLNTPLNSAANVLKSQVIYAIRYEMAMKPNDFLCRRAGLGFLDMKVAEENIEVVADLFAKELKWSASKLKAEKDEAKENIKFLF